MNPEQLPPSDLEPAAAQEPAAPNKGSALAPLALIIALLAGAASAWNAWQMQQNSPASVEESIAKALPQNLVTSEQLTPVLAAQATGDEQWQQLREAINAQDSQLSELKTALAQNQSQLAKVHSKAQYELRLAEAEHLLRLASVRLSALQDINSAVALLKGADHVLREQDDPNAFAVRKALAVSTESLLSVPRPDRTGLFLKIDALREQALRLQDAAPSFEPQQTVLDTTKAQWQQWLEKISHFVRIDFASKQDIRPLLSGQQLEQARLALGLALQQAQWAALNGQGAIYQQSLKQAQEIVDQQFGRNVQQSRAFAERLDELNQQSVELDVPDLQPALDALQSYIKQHRQLEEPEASAPVEEAQP